MKIQVPAKKANVGVGVRSHLPIFNHMSPDVVQKSSPDADLEESTLHPDGYNLANVPIFAKSLGSNQRNTLHGSTGRLPMQQKLTIGKPNDKYEQEADRVAQQVVQQISSPKTVRLNQRQTIQRKVVPNENKEENLKLSFIQQNLKEGITTATSTLENSIQQAQGNGQLLPGSIRESMEEAFGSSFSDVKIHDNAQSNFLNESLFSLAFTSKKDIFFRRGIYNPKSLRSKSIIAHELTHVLQQTGKSKKPDKGGEAEKYNLKQNNRVEQGNEASIVPSGETQKLKPDIQEYVPHISPQKKSIQMLPDPSRIKELEQSIKEQKWREPMSMGSLMKTKVKVKTPRTGTELASKNLTQIGLARIAYIVENQDDETGTVYRFESGKDSVIEEATAIINALATTGREGGGGGLLHSTSDKQWAYNKPGYSPMKEKKLYQNRQKLPYWRSPDSKEKPKPDDPTPTTLHTPGGTELVLVTSYNYSEGGEENTTHTYASGAPNRGLPLDSDPGKVASSMKKLTVFPHAQKRTGEVTITEKLLNKWAGSRKGSTGQNQVMGNTSANEAAAASGYVGNGWQWLHLIAFTFGGIDGIDPNVQNNLVAGQAAANGKHLVLENLVKRLILSHYTDEVKIMATAYMKHNSYHVAEKIKYLITWKDQKTDKHVVPREYEINTLDPSKSMGGHLNLLYAEFT